MRIFIYFTFFTQKLHPNDGEVHNDSYLCEILQVQSIQLLPNTDDDTLKLEKNEIEQTLCDRCRRFAVPTPQTLCERCELVLADPSQSQQKFN